MHNKFILLYYYVIILLYYKIIILIYYYIIILADYTIYWPFSNHGFCFTSAPYQWSGIIKDCSKHRISARIFSMFEKTRDFNDFLWFLWLSAFLGPWPLGPMGPSFPIFWKFVKWSGTYLEVFLGCLGPQGTP